MLQYLAAAMVSLFAQGSQPSYEELWPNVDAAMASMYTGKYNQSDFSVEYYTEQTDPRFPASLRPVCNISAVKDDQDCLVDLKPFAKITYKGKGGQYWGLAYLFPRVGSTSRLKRPVVIADGYDPGDDNFIGNRHNAENLRLKHDNLLGIGPSGLRYWGYDIVLMDFSQGGGDIFINSGIYAKLVQELALRTEEPLVIGGPSMGGMIARVASLYLLPKNNAAGVDYSENILGYLSIDTPHQGAQINSWIQEGTYKGKDLFLVKEETYTVKLWGYKLKEFEVGNSMPRVNWNKLTTPAAWQMLYLHYNPQNDNALSSTSHDFFYSRVSELGGHNVSFPLAAVAYSNFYNPTYDQIKRLGCRRSDNATLTPGWVGDSYKAWTGCNDNFQDFQPGSSLGYIADYSVAPEKVIKPYMFPVCYDMPSGAAHAVETCPSNWWTGRYRPWTGTFIPIASALDMKFESNIPGNVVFLQKKLETADGGLTKEEVRKMTPFGYIGYMENKLSKYKGVEYPKYMHIEFDDALIAEARKALEYLDAYRTARKSALLKSRAKRSAASIRSILFD